MQAALTFWYVLINTKAGAKYSVAKFTFSMVNGLLMAASPEIHDPCHLRHAPFVHLSISLAVLAFKGKKNTTPKVEHRY